MKDYQGDLKELSRTLGENLVRGADIKNVFGEPVSVGKKTVIPVARLGYGYGGGLGGGEDEDEKEKGSGGGFGGGLGARPAGAFEITGKRTRFIPYRDGRSLGVVLGLGLGVAFGLLLGRGLKR